MSEQAQQIRDRSGKVLGTIYTECGDNSLKGNARAMKNGGGTVGRYDARLDKTFTVTGTPVSNGNTLASLLF